MLKQLDTLAELGGAGTAVAVIDDSGEVLVVHAPGEPLIDPVVAAAAVHNALVASTNTDDDSVFVAHLERASVYGEQIGGHLYVAVTTVPTAPGVVLQRIRAAFRDLHAAIGPAAP
jgi:hypothetical protein